jgi:NTE family protein
MSGKKKTSRTKPKGGPKHINLALQGGGAHGAFTWGVLDRILEDDRLTIEGISGTSAGALNGTIATYGLLKGGPTEARALLQQFWERTSAIMRYSLLQPTLMDKFFGHDVTYSAGFMVADLFTRFFSPYQYNLFDLNPLKLIIEQMVDFELIRKNQHIKLFVNATHVRSGKIKVFRTEEMTSDRVLASACLPQIFKTVMVDGEPYWDGGYSGNPALFPLFYQCQSQDIVIVQINPLYVEDIPTSAAEIVDRVNEISFNSTLMREVRAIEFVKRLLAENRIPEGRYTNVLLHLIETEEVMSELGSASKMNVDWDFLTYLRQTGYQAANDWVEKHFDALGHRSSVDLSRYL